MSLGAGNDRSGRHADHYLMNRIFGFIVGLTFTVNGGATIDLIYHATMFPVLIVTALMLGRGAGASALGR